MENEGLTNKKNSVGSLIAQVIVLCAVPFIITVLVYNGLRVFRPEFGTEVNRWTAAVAGGICGVVFHASCMLVINAWQYAVITLSRLSDFFADLKFSFKIAVSGYKENVKENGLNLLFYVLTFAFNVAWLVVGLARVLPLIG